MQSTALEGAAQQAEMLDVVNAFYTSQVVDRVQSHGIVVTHDYATKNGAIPLPATFTIESGQRIGERSKTGMLFRLYSDYPFRSRKDGGPHDDFERDALADLRREPRRPGLPLRGLPGPPVAAVCDGPADGGRLHRLPQQRHRTAPSATGRWAKSAASWRSSARWTATSPARARGCAGPSC